MRLGAAGGWDKAIPAMLLLSGLALAAASFTAYVALVVFDVDGPRRGFWTAAPPVVFALIVAAALARRRGSERLAAVLLALPAAGGLATLAAIVATLAQP